MADFLASGQSALDGLLGNLPVGQLAIRIGLVALFVVSISLIAERLGPFLGGMMASLPVYTGPVYLMLALEHDTAYIEASTTTSIAICGAVPVFIMAYAALARRHGVWLSLSTAIAAWSAAAYFVQSRIWSLGEALLFVVPIYAGSIAVARRFTRGVAPRTAQRRAGDLVIRAVLVALLAGVVIIVSRHAPPQVTGVLSVLPIVLTSLVLVMHPRVGGAATAALLSHTLGGLVGMVIAFVVVNRTLQPLGVWAALALGLAVTLGWNVAMIVTRRMMVRR